MLLNNINGNMYQVITVALFDVIYGVVVVESCTLMFVIGGYILCLNET
jgi:hypothetical protein